MIYIICAVVILILILDEFFVKDRRALKMVENIPGAFRFPLVGSIHTAIFRSEAERSEFFLNYYKDYKDIAKYHVGPKLVLCIFKPEYLQIIFNSKDMLERNYLMRLTENVFGDGLIRASVPLWKKQRKTVNPQFNQTVANNFVPVAAENSVKLVENMKRDLNNGEAKDMIVYAINFATDVLCETYFETEMGVQESNTEEVYEFLETTISVAMNLRVMNIFNHYDMYYKCASRFYQGEQEQLRFLDDFVRKVLENKKKQSERVLDSGDEKQTLLDVLIEKHLQGEITEKLLLDEIKSFLMAGIDTNALTLCYTLLLLGMYPETQDKLYEEVNNVLGPDRHIQLTDFPNLKYTECVLKEALRIFPTVPLSPRESQQDVRLDSDIVIPKGCAVLVNFMGLHRSEHIWPDPLVFKPERFFPENSLNRHPYSWLPFSAGSRNCIGRRFAMNVLKTVLPMVVRSFKFKTSYKTIEDVKLKPCISMVPTHGFGLSFVLREN